MGRGLCAIVILVFILCNMKRGRSCLVGQQKAQMVVYHTVQDVEFLFG